MERAIFIFQSDFICDQCNKFRIRRLTFSCAYRISEKLIEARENYSSLAAQYKSACAQMEKDIHDTSALEKRLTELKRLTDEYSLVSEKLSQEVSLSAQKLAAASTSHEAAVSEEKAAVQKLALAKEAAEKVLKK